LIAIETSATPRAMPDGDASGSCFSPLIASTPMPTATAPTTKPMNTVTNVSTRPWPCGWSSSAGAVQNFTPRITAMSVTESVRLWRASASTAWLWPMIPAAAFAAASNRLQIRPTQPTRRTFEIADSEIVRSFTSLFYQLSQVGHCCFLLESTTTGSPMRTLPGPP